ncbi:MAG: hypothetical protein H7Y07_12635 [Pyrinomonadaceae bacterium]|nr:hypothetical protein [Sphingobacteriaceae bacterium]
MLSEKECIQACKKLIEQKFGFPESKLWKQREFEFLAELILTKTATRLSISTLKRIWKDPEGRLPHIYTLNALAGLAGFESWNNFKHQHHHPPAHNSKERTEIKWGILISILSIAAFCITGFFYLQRDKHVYNKNQIVFKTRRVISDGVPNTVVFEYDISKTVFDSAFIQHTWDKRLRARISKNNHFQTFIYYVPGFHIAKLILNDSIIIEKPINIPTAGWTAIIDPPAFGQHPIYIPPKDIFYKHQLFVTRQTLLKNQVPLENKKYWVNYYNVSGPKEVSGDNFILETSLKNSIENGGLVCQFSTVSILCENGRISVPFCKPGCSANIQLHVSEIFKHGRKNDLSAFGTDLSVFKNIKISVFKKLLTVYVDGKKIFDLPYHVSLGRITGFHYKFFGQGSVDMIKLYNAKQDLYFSDNFGP